MDDEGGGILDLPLTGTGSTRAPETKPEVDEAGLKENPCVDAAWTRLKNEASIRTLIEKFMGERSILNLTLQVSNLNGDYVNTFK